jgi:hypothetical protein
MDMKYNVNSTVKWADGKTTTENAFFTGRSHKGVLAQALELFKSSLPEGHNAILTDTPKDVRRYFFARRYAVTAADGQDLCVLHLTSRIF